MDKKQLIEMIEAVSYEKSMPKDRVRKAMESAIAALARRQAKPEDGEFGARIENDGSLTTWRVWRYVDAVENAFVERLADNKNKAGTVVHETIDNPQWTRQGRLIVKQVLAQRLREGLRETVYDSWKDRVGEIVTGIVKRVSKSGYVIDLGEPAEGILSGRDTIPKESLRPGFRVRALVRDVKSEGNGPSIILSRTDEDFLRELITREVPEVSTGQVVIHSIARDPGQRAKIAVSAGPGLRQSATGTCVGMRGVRAQAVSNEINGERLDFVDWSENIADFVLAAMAPAQIDSLVIEEADRRVLMGIKAERLGRAIGSGGQNIRLASKLTGWKIEAMSLEDLAARREKEDSDAVARLASALELDDELATVLVHEGGFYNVDEIAFSSLGDLLNIEGIDEDMAEELQNRGRDYLLNKELEEAEADVARGPQSLSELDGISEEDVAKLVEQGIDTIEKLADCGIMDVIWDEERDDELAAWIMSAREATTNV